MKKTTETDTFGKMSPFSTSIRRNNDIYEYNIERDEHLCVSYHNIIDIMQYYNYDTVVMLAVCSTSSYVSIKYLLIT